MAAGGHLFGSSQPPRDRHSRAGTNFNQTHLGGGTGGPAPQRRPFSDDHSRSIQTAIGGKTCRGAKSSRDHCIFPFGFPFPESTGTSLPCPCQFSRHTSDGSPPAGISEDRHTAVDDEKGASLRAITGAAVSPPPKCISSDTTMGPPSNCNRASRYSQRNWWRHLGITALTHRPSRLFLFKDHTFPIPHDPDCAPEKFATLPASIRGDDPRVCVAAQLQPWAGFRKAVGLDPSRVFETAGEVPPKAVGLDLFRVLEMASKG